MSAPDCKTVPIPPPLCPPTLSRTASLLERQNSNLLPWKPLTPQGMANKAHEYISQVRQLDDGHLCLSCYNSVEPLLQDGPQCGLVSLAMAAQSMGFHGVTVNKLMMVAIDKGYSLNGEILSVSYLLEIACEVFRCSGHVMDVRSNQGAILDNLFRNKLMLIPYDADRNHQPCCKRGHKAHWALLTGYYLRLPHSGDFRDSLEKHFAKDIVYPNLFYGELTDFDVEQGNSFGNSVSDVFVYGQQGKSRHPGIWPLDDLLESNMNLHEFNPDRTLSQIQYVQPEGGIQRGLLGQILVLDRVFDPH